MVSVVEWLLLRTPPKQIHQHLLHMFPKQEMILSPAEWMWKPHPFSTVNLTGSWSERHSRAGASNVYMQQWMKFLRSQLMSAWQMEQSTMNTMSLSNVKLTLWFSSSPNPPLATIVSVYSQAGPGMVRSTTWRTLFSLQTQGPGILSNCWRLRILASIRKSASYANSLGGTLSHKHKQFSHQCCCFCCRY